MIKQECSMCHEQCEELYDYFGYFEGNYFDMICRQCWIDILEEEPE